ncbi:hypothetical protein Sango_2106400 [Sesamum angolense]|uniref:Reverse transcriptase domain-containing protein n=1 Tax=Sesamum angolense TaxID=2727404 RepID=A0AAE1WBS7_9LAMI|nr:hypothetical protein Sango_2106400 [Sesamum angolense]
MPTINPTALLQPLKSPCPFDQWGMDLVKLFPQAVGQWKFLIAIVDYFTKWKKLKKWFKGLMIKKLFTLVNNMQVKGQTEVTNRMILQHLNSRTATKESPFTLSYNTEVVTPTKIEELSWRVKHYDPASNVQGLRMNLDFVDEVREIVTVLATMYKTRMAKVYNAKSQAKKLLGAYKLQRLDGRSVPRT